MCIMHSWLVLCVVFFCKQKTAYEMRISDWSSDVCSSDLAELRRLAFTTVVDVGEVHDRLVLALDRDAHIEKGMRGDADAVLEQIGRASCRERVCQYV